MMRVEEEPMITMLRMLISSSRKRPQGAVDDPLVFRAKRGGEADGSGGRTMFEEDGGGFLQLMDAAMAARIIERGGKVGLGDGAQARLNLLPGDEQIAEADGGEVEHERRAEARGRSASGRDSGHDFDLDVEVQGFGQLVGEASHAVDAGVARGNERDDVSGGGQLQSLLAARGLLQHGRGDDLLAGGEVGDEIDIVTVADHDAAGSDGSRGARSAVKRASRAYANHAQLSCATATVTE